MKTNKQKELQRITTDPVGEALRLSLCCKESSKNERDVEGTQPPP